MCSKTNTLGVKKIILMLFMFIFVILNNANSFAESNKQNFSDLNKEEKLILLEKNIKIIDKAVLNLKNKLENDEIEY
jgi:hypothetical protein